MSKQNLLKTNPAEEMKGTKTKVKQLKKSERQANLNDLILDQLDKDVVFSFRTKDSKREKIKRLAGVAGKTTEELMNDLMDEYIAKTQDILNMIDNVE